MSIKCLQQLKTCLGFWLIQKVRNTADLLLVGISLEWTRPKCIKLSRRWMKLAKCKWLFFWWNFRYDLSEDTSKVTGDMRYIYHMILFAKDHSVENVDRFLNVYILTNEGDQVSLFWFLNFRICLICGILFQDLMMVRVGKVWIMVRCLILRLSSRVWRILKISVNWLLSCLLLILVSHSSSYMIQSFYHKCQSYEHSV